MKNFLFALLSLAFSHATMSTELKWNCGELQLEFNEVPMQPGREVKIRGCWQEKTFFLVSENCKADIKKCLEKGKGHELNHPGGGMGSPFFILCYKSGGKPRFLKLKAQEKWENTSTCFFGEEKSFADYDTINQSLKK